MQDNTSVIFNDRFSYINVNSTNLCVVKAAPLKEGIHQAFAVKSQGNEGKIFCHAFL
jgi:hypothetical protein